MALIMLLDLLNQCQIDIAQRLALKISVQEKIQTDHILFFQRAVEIDYPVLQDAAFQHHHGKNLISAYQRKLYELQLADLRLRCRNHRRVIRARRQKLYNLLEHLLQPVNLLDHDFILLLCLGRLLLEHVVYIETISLVGRDPSRRCMRLKNVAHVFQIRHLIPDRRGAKVKIGKLGDGPRAYRLTCVKVSLNNSIQNLYLTFIQFHRSHLLFYLLALIHLEC